MFERRLFLKVGMAGLASLLPGVVASQTPPPASAPAPQPPSEAPKAAPDPRAFDPAGVVEAARALSKKPYKAPAADLTGRGTILLVEDEEAVRAFGARALSSRGYTVLEAASGREALDVVEAENGKIDLIVSDVVMPEMDGPTMFGELRKRGIKCKVIFVSGYAEDAFQKNLPAGEDFGFLPKPFTLKQLVEAVKGNLS